MIYRSINNNITIVLLNNNNNNNELLIIHCKQKYINIINVAFVIYNNYY